MIQPHLLAAPQESSAGSVVIAVVVVLAGIVIMFGALAWMRKRMKQPDTTAPAGFTLGDLRELVTQGKMTPAEFERAKSKVLEATKRATEVKPAQDTTVHKQFPTGLG